MEEVNKFYSTYQSEANKNEFQIRELGPDTHRGMGVMFSDGYGNVEGGEVFSSPTTQKDYDELFTKSLLDIDPPYRIEEFLSFHFDRYKNKDNSDLFLFLKHIRYVILIQVRRSQRQECNEIVANWIEEQEKLLTRPKNTKVNAYFTNEEIELTHKKLDELFEKITSLKLGQQIIYDDLVDEIDELKELVNQLSKKNWFEILQGKLISVGLGKLTDKGLELINSTFVDQKLIS